MKSKPFSFPHRFNAWFVQVVFLKNAQSVGLEKMTKTRFLLDGFDVGLFKMVSSKGLTQMSPPTLGKIPHHFTVSYLS